MLENKLDEWEKPFICPAVLPCDSGQRHTGRDVWNAPWRPWASGTKCCYEWKRRKLVISREKRSKLGIWFLILFSKSLSWARVKRIFPSFTQYLCCRAQIFVGHKKGLGRSWPNTSRRKNDQRTIPYKGHCPKKRQTQTARRLRPEVPRRKTENRRKTDAENRQAMRVIDWPNVMSA